MDVRPLTPFVAPPGSAPLRAAARPAASAEGPQDTAEVGRLLPGADLAKTPGVPAQSLAHIAGASSMATLAAFGTLFAVAHNATAGQVFPPDAKTPGPSIARTVEAGPTAPVRPVLEVAAPGPVALAAPVQAAPVAPPLEPAAADPLPLLARMTLSPESFLQPLPAAPTPTRPAGDPTGWLLAGEIGAPASDPWAKELQSLTGAPEPEVKPPPASPAAIPAVKGDYVKHGINFSHLLTDAEFQNSGAMTAEDVQAFLEHQKSGLATFSEGGRTAAEIVVEAAQKHQVNPMVILTTLEKEVGLISYQPRPSGWRSRSAMGYAYTDSGNRPRGSSFAWQVDKGTELMRELFDEAAGTAFPKKKSVDYGAREITVRNAATWALMRYTPHTVDTQLRQTGGGNYNFRKIFERFHGERLELYEKTLSVETNV